MSVTGCVRAWRRIVLSLSVRVVMMMTVMLLLMLLLLLLLLLVMMMESPAAVDIWTQEIERRTRQLLGTNI